MSATPRCVITDLLFRLAVDPAVCQAVCPQPERVSSVGNSTDVRIQPKPSGEAQDNINCLQHADDFERLVDTENVLCNLIH